MTRRPTGSTRSATLTPYTTLFRSFGNAAFAGGFARVELRGLLLPLQPHGAGVVEFGDALRVGDATHDRTGHAAAGHARPFARVAIVEVVEAGCADHVRIGDGPVLRSHRAGASQGAGVAHRRQLVVVVAPDVAEVDAGAADAQAQADRVVVEHRVPGAFGGSFAALPACGLNQLPRGPGVGVDAGLVEGCIVR